MSSQRMLELVNVLHHRISEDQTKKNPFGWEADGTGG